MNTCTHCEAIRREHADLMEQFSLDHLPRWGERDDVDAALRQIQAGPLSQVGECPCRCHVPARIAGKLPRLGTAA